MTTNEEGYTQGIIDLHTHILPQLDDGATNWEEALKMCMLAQEEGITTVACTPHIMPGIYNNDREKIFSTLLELKEKLKEKKINLRVLPGAEVLLSPEIIKQVEEKLVLTLNDGGKFLLLDFPREWISPFTKELLFWLQLRGLIPIISHPERNLKILQTPNLVTQFVKQGVLIQISSRSILGHFGKKVRKLCEKLISHNLVHLVASDIHSAGEFFLKQSLKTISRWAGEEKALKLFFKNPRKIIQGESLGD